MSRIGKKPVEVPEKVNVTIKERLVEVKGPNGALTYTHNPEVEVSQKDNTLVVTPLDSSNKSRALWGLTRTLLSNMVEGVTKGFTKSLEFNGVGYKAAVSGNKLTLNLGYSHPIDYELPEGVTAKVTRNVIDISGANKELVGFTAAKIRSFRPPEPYKGKGVKYANETIIRKAGKAGAKK
ncbi:MAG: 50S ribosomal protein L6 [Halobacteriovoraceae bacterium]|nr:50S ribosomal protein L6 [Halobacteriovoraceae bacterium]|tara:strand:- start:63562 stop:64101 length:540 start_codon:yes stop_codon:yes gene_type:complete